MVSPHNARIMGVINVTPDSFSDGGEFLAVKDALKQAEVLVADGADIIDLGAESTRPGAVAVNEAEEWRRLAPVLTELRRALPVPISIDSRKTEIIKRSLDCGVLYINNVAGVADTGILQEIARYPDVNYIAMHMRETPATMQTHPLTPAVAIREVESFFCAAEQALIDVGLSRERIFLDPGIGFGKTIEANIALLLKTTEWSKKYSLALGISRKSFIGTLLDLPQPTLRDAPGKVIELCLMMSGAKIIRTHAVKQLAILRKLTGELGIT